MTKRTAEPAPTLYQSQWWARLAAISEKRESPAPDEGKIEDRAFLKRWARSSSRILEAT